MISPVFGVTYLVLQIVSAVVILAVYIFRAPKDKFSLLAVAIATFMLFVTAVNERMGRLWIYTQWFYD